MPQRIRRILVALVLSLEVAVLAVTAVRIDTLARAGWAKPVNQLGLAAPLEAVLGSLAVWTLAGIGAWFLITAVAYLGATLTGRTAMARRIGLITPPLIRRLADRIAAVSLTVAMLGPATPVLAANRPDGPDPSPGVPLPSAEIHHPGIERLARNAHPTTPSTEPADTAGPRLEHLVVRGDNLWRIAAGHLANAPEAAIGLRAYWLMVIEANRDRIRSGDPDLIYPGEIILLPQLPELP